MKLVRMIVAVVAILGCQAASAVVAVSNLENTPEGLVNFTQNGLAFWFRTSDTGPDQTLKSVTIPTFAAGNEVGTSLHFSLWFPNLKEPQVAFEDGILEGGFNDLTVLAKNPFTLEAGVTYWLVVTADADRKLSGWGFTHDFDESGLPGWTVWDGGSLQLASLPCPNCNLAEHTELINAAGVPQVLRARVNVVPEPSSLSLLGIGVLVAAAARRRRRSEVQYGRAG